MKNKIIYFFTIIVLTVFVCVFFSNTDETMPFYVMVSSDEKTEQIHCWKNNENEYYVFLPGYAELSDVQIGLNTENSVSINETALYDGMFCNGLEFNVPYNLTYFSFGKKHNHKLTFVKSDNVASFYIDTASGNMEYIHNKKGNAETGTARLYTSEGKLDYTGNLESIKGRGNYTWDEFEKKPYNIKLLNEADLLGMGTAQKWILLANADDPSNLRNKIIYDLAERMGMPFTPEATWVDLYLNGEYAGLYLLCERNEVHPERVNISTDNGFLVSMELKERLVSQNYEFISTEANQSLRIHYPLQPSEVQKSSLLSHFQSLENALLSEDGIDPSTGKNWQELIDLDSWAKKYLIEEVFGNYDASLVSQYFYFDPHNEKIHYGPVWDYDHSIGNISTWQLANPQNLYANNLIISQTLNNPWFSSLYQKEEFYNRMIDIYEKEFLPSLNKLLAEDINNYSLLISDSAALNHLRWFDDESSASSEVQYILSYMTERIEFLNNIWLENKPYHLVCADNGFGVNYAYSAVYDKECFIPYQFKNTENLNFIGWFYCDTDQPFDITKPITEDIKIYAKWQDSSSNKADNILKLIPLAVMALIFVILSVVEIKKIRNSR